MKFSPSTGGFYSEFLSYPDMPTDCIIITDDEHMAALAVLHGHSDKPVKIGKEKLVIAPPQPKTDTAPEQTKD